MKANSPLALALLIGAAPAFAAVTVSSPTNGATVNTTFNLNASATACSSQPIGAMGYSFDNSPDTTILAASSINTKILAPVGNHILHVKSWGKRGSSCSAALTLNVIVPPSNTPPPPPKTDLAVSAPLSGASLQSPFNVNATGTVCSGQALTAVGYSLDSSATTNILNGSVLNSAVTATPGQHTLHVKGWGPKGAACVADVTVSVLAPPPPPPPPPPPSEDPIVPANAIAVKDIQNLAHWNAVHDVQTGNGAFSAGKMAMVNSPSISGSTRQFNTQYARYGGERYSVHIGTDGTAKNLLYDAYLYLAGPADSIANIEMDMNQVIANGDTVIYGFQCDGWSKTWDYTANKGTRDHPDDTWLHSNQTCDPQSWATDMWHHVQISYSRDDAGNVTYHSVWLDGKKQDLEVTVFAGFNLHWGHSLLMNFQVDGNTATQSASTVYMDNVTVYRW